MELWTLLDPASKHAGERLKLAILLDLHSNWKKHMRILSLRILNAILGGGGGGGKVAS